MAKLLKPARTYNPEVFDYLKSLHFQAVAEGDAETEIEKVVQKAPANFSKLELTNVQQVVALFKNLYGSYADVLHMIKNSVTPLLVKADSTKRKITFFASQYGDEYLQTIKETPSSIICSKNKYNTLQAALKNVLTEEEASEYLKSYKRVKWALFNTSTKFDLAKVNEILLKEYSRDDVKKILFNSCTIYSRDSDFYVQLFSQLQELTILQQQDFKTKLLNNPDAILFPLTKRHVPAKTKKQKTEKSKPHKTHELSELDEEKRGDYSEDLLEKTKFSKDEARGVIEAYLRKSQIKLDFLDEEFNGLLKNYSVIASRENVAQHEQLISTLYSKHSFTTDTLKALTILRSAHQAIPMLDQLIKDANIVQSTCGDEAAVIYTTYDPAKLYTSLQSREAYVLLKNIWSSAKTLAKRITKESGSWVHDRTILNKSSFALATAFRHNLELRESFPEVATTFSTARKATGLKDEYFQTRSLIMDCTDDLAETIKKEIQTASSNGRSEDLPALNTALNIVAPYTR